MGSMQVVGTAAELGPLIEPVILCPMPGRSVETFAMSGAESAVGMVLVPF